MDSMNIREYLNNIESWSGDNREKYLRPLLQILSPVSHQTLREHQIKGHQSFDEFVKTQNQEIIKCIQLELSELGKQVRGKFLLEPLSLETEIEL